MSRAGGGSASRLRSKLAVNADRGHLLTADSTYLAILWRLPDLQIMHRFDVHTARITTVGFTADGRRLLTASMDGSVRVWDVGSGEPSIELRHPQGVRDAQFLADGRQVLTLCADGWLRRFDGNSLAR